MSVVALDDGSKNLEPAVTEGLGDVSQLPLDDKLAILNDPAFAAYDEGPIPNVKRHEKMRNMQIYLAKRHRSKIALERRRQKLQIMLSIPAQGTYV